MNSALAQESSTAEVVTCNPAGRPLKYQDPEAFQIGIDNYFADCDATGKPYTITGLCLSLGTTRETIREYEARPAFVYAIKQAKEKVANYAESMCYKARNPAGAIFLAKNHGFRDTQQLDITSRLTYDLPDQVKALTDGED